MHRYCVLVGGRLEFETPERRYAEEYAAGVMAGMRDDASSAGGWAADTPGVCVCEVLQGWEVMPPSGTHQDFALVVWG
jgi:hypothetical protein